MSKIVQLYYDNKNTIKAYPRTTTSCVFDESGKSVKEQLETIVIDVSKFGAIGDYNKTTKIGTENSVYINNAINYAKTNKIKKIKIGFTGSGIYMLNKPILLDSDMELIVDDNVTLFLADNSNCPLVEVTKLSYMSTRKESSTITNDKWFKNIKISGGIWEFNGDNQPHLDTNNLYNRKSFGMVFQAIDGLTLQNMKLINSQVYAIYINVSKNVYVNNIDITQIWDMNNSTSYPLHNQDGIHFSGYTENVLVENIKALCYDDAIALNACDTIDYEGDIKNVVIRNITFKDCLNDTGSIQGVRLLPGTKLIDNVVIENIKGMISWNLINIDNYGLGDGVGKVGNLTIDGVYCTGNGFNNGTFITIGDVVGDKITIKNVYVPIMYDLRKTIMVKENARIGILEVENLKQGITNYSSIGFLVERNASINSLTLSDFYYIKNDTSYPDSIFSIIELLGSTIGSVNVSNINSVGFLYNSVYVQDLTVNDFKLRNISGKYSLPIKIKNSVIKNYMTTNINVKSNTNLPLSLENTTIQETQFNNIDSFVTASFNKTCTQNTYTTLNLSKINSVFTTVSSDYITLNTVGFYLVDVQLKLTSPNDAILKIINENLGGDNTTILSMFQHSTQPPDNISHHLNYILYNDKEFNNISLSLYCGGYNASVIGKITIKSI